MIEWRSIYQLNVLDQGVLGLLTHLSARNEVRTESGNDQLSSEH
jgi:hypothetical protein